MNNKPIFNLNFENLVLALGKLGSIRKALLRISQLAEKELGKSDLKSKTVEEIKRLADSVRKE